MVINVSYGDDASNKGKSNQSDSSKRLLGRKERMKGKNAPRRTLSVDRGISSLKKSKLKEKRPITPPLEERAETDEVILGDPSLSMVESPEADPPTKGKYRTLTLE